MSAKKVFSTTFDKSIQTLALYQQSVFLSVFSSYIVFGEAISTGFKKDCFFKLNFFDLFKLYAEIVKITVFFGSEKEKDHGIFFIDNSINYCWYGDTKKKNDSIEKIVSFVLNKNEQKTYELIFTIPEINNFYDVLSRSIIPTLCLKDNEQLLLIEASTLSSEAIINLKTDYCQLNSFIDQFCKKHFNQKVRISTFRELLIYYNDVILLVNKLSLLKCNIRFTSMILAPLEN
jgi:hypothetical protein